MEYLLIIVAVIFVVNFAMLLTRRSKAKTIARKAAEEKADAERRLYDIKRKLEHEQIDAERRVELRDRMLERLDTARRRDDTSGSSDEDPDSITEKDV